MINWNCIFDRFFKVIMCSLLSYTVQKFRVSKIFFFKIVIKK